MNERELIAKAQAGDFEAFSVLVNANKSKIYALGLKMTANPQDAEDIVQETFLKAIDNIDKFRGESSFGTWLSLGNLHATRVLARCGVDWLTLDVEHAPIPAREGVRRGCRCLFAQTGKTVQGDRADSLCASARFEARNVPVDRWRIVTEKGVQTSRFRETVSGKRDPEQKLIRPRMETECLLRGPSKNR